MVGTQLILRSAAAFATAQPVCASCAGGIIVVTWGTIVFFVALVGVEVGHGEEDVFEEPLGGAVGSGGVEVVDGGVAGPLGEG